LRYGDEVRDEDEYFERVEDTKPDPKMLSMVEQIIEDRTTAWSEKMVEDPVQDRLMAIIKAKQSPKKRPKAKKTEDAPETPSNVIDLMAALKKSLEGKPSSRKGA